MTPTPRVVILSAAKNLRIWEGAGGFSPLSWATEQKGLQPRALAAALCLFTLAAAGQGIPNIKPGDSCEKLRATYGNETSLDGPAHIWEQGVLEIKVLVKPNGPCVAGSIQYSVQSGHTLATRDGIILGRDTTASAALKLKGRINSTSYYFIRGEGKAYAMLEVPPTPAYPFKSTYGWVLNPTLTARLSAPPTLADFTTEPVTFYAVDPPNPPGVQ